MVGQKFGKLTVIEYAGTNKRKSRTWLCKCDCGNTKICDGWQLRSGKTNSCGECKYIDITGQRFGKLQVIKYYGKSKKGALWLCKCDCGNETIVNGGSLRSGHTQSCGCLQKEITIQKQTTHGKTNNRVYWVWASMKNRCYNSNYSLYRNHGGRGIRVCDEWKDNFQAFYDWSINNGYDENLPKGKCTLDRIDNNGNYEPSNCRWVDMEKQSNNTRRNVYYMVDGEKMTIAEIARKYNIKYSTLYSRFQKWHYSVEEAISGIRNET